MEKYQADHQNMGDNFLKNPYHSLGQNFQEKCFIFSIKWFIFGKKCFLFGKKCFIRKCFILFIVIVKCFIFRKESIIFGQRLKMLTKCPPVIS